MSGTREVLASEGHTNPHATDSKTDRNSHVSPSKTREWLRACAHAMNLASEDAASKSNWSFCPS